MKYLSPFNLLAETLGTVENIDRSTLRKAKKRLLSEFELFEATTIEVSGTLLDKDALLKIFDELESESSLSHHLLIYKNKPLLQFLEAGDHALFFQVKLLNKEEDNKDFIGFITPYFAEVYNTELFNAVRNNDLNIVEILVSHDLPIDFRQEATAYKNTYRLLKSQSNDLKNIAIRSKKEHVLGSEIIAFFHPTFLAIFDLLPAYFEGVRNEFADIVDGLAVDLHNKSRRTSLAIEILEACMDLNLSEQVKYRLNYVYKQIKPHHKTFKKWHPEPETEKKSIMNVVILVVQIIFLALMVYFGLKG